MNNTFTRGSQEQNTWGRRTVNELERQNGENNGSRIQRKKKEWNNKSSLRDLGDIIKCTNIQVTGVPGEEKKYAKIFEGTILRNLPTVGEKLDI